jgi:hypothetical protein
MARLESVLAKVDEGEGALPMLINDPASAERVRTTLANLEQTSADLSALASEVRNSDGLLQRLLLDEQYGEEVAGEIERVIERVDRLSVEITEGEGTVARLIQDPSIYESINDILVGIEESRILRWLIRNRQNAGIERRYEDAVEAGEVPPLPPGEEVPRPGEPAPPSEETEPAQSGPEASPATPEPEPEAAAEETEEETPPVDAPPEASKGTARSKTPGGR